MTRWVLIAIVMAVAFPAAQIPERPAPTQAPPTRPKSPPQPQQEQGLDYFIGTWDFAWVGRDTPLSAGPRSGVATFKRLGTSDFMEVLIEGKSEMGTAFKEAATIGWNPALKTMVFRERFANGVDALSIGEWGTPLAIHVATQPVRVGNATWNLRRTYSITAGHAFVVLEELSVGGAPFERLGKAEFIKQVRAKP